MPATSYWFLGFEKRFPPPPSPILWGFVWIKVISFRDRRFPTLRCAGLSCWSPATPQMLSRKHFLALWHQVKAEERHRTGLNPSKSWAQPPGKAAGRSIPAGRGAGGARPAVTARQQVRRSTPHAQPEKGPEEDLSRPGGGRGCAILLRIWFHLRGSSCAN